MHHPQATPNFSVFTRKVGGPGTKQRASDVSPGINLILHVVRGNQIFFGLPAEIIANPCLSITGGKTRQEARQTTL